MNRNTVNSDIKYWYTQMGSQIGVENLGGMFFKQIERLELQRKRLLDEIEKQTDFSSKITLEKMIFGIDNKMVVSASKLIEKNLKAIRIGNTEEISEEEISEEEISEIVKYLIFKGGKSYFKGMPEEEILQNIIMMKKCDIDYAKNVVNTMRKLGLELCRTSGISPGYRLDRFASMRAYLSEEELQSLSKKAR